VQGPRDLLVGIAMGEFRQHLKLAAAHAVFRAARAPWRDPLLTQRFKEAGDLGLHQAVRLFLPLLAEGLAKEAFHGLAMVEEKPDGALPHAATEGVSKPRERR